MDGLIPLALDFFPNQLWESSLGWVVTTVSIIAMLGSMAGNLTIAAVAGYGLFAFYAIHMSDPVITNLFYASIVLFVTSFGFKFWRLEGQ